MYLFIYYDSLTNTYVSGFMTLIVIMINIKLGVLNN